MLFQSLLKLQFVLPLYFLLQFFFSLFRACLFDSQIWILFAFVIIEDKLPRVNFQSLNDITAVLIIFVHNVRIRSSLE